MEVNDKRSKSGVVFDDIPLGTVFQDIDGDICIKTDDGAMIYLDPEDRTWNRHTYDADEHVIVLDATLEVRGG